MTLRKLYTVNHNVAIDFIKIVTQTQKLTFDSQNELYCFIEDIKNPFLRSRRLRRSKMRGFSENSPMYQGNKNYGPVINYLLYLEILSVDVRNKCGYKFTVNSTDLVRVLNTNRYKAI